MPILAREIDTYPEDLFDQADASLGADCGWWTMYTRSRQEKELLRRLLALDVPFYCPIVPRRTRSPSGRIRIAHVPLFSNYVFIFGDEDKRRAAQTTNCVSRWLEVPDSVELTKDLRQIRQLIETGAPLTPEERLQPGMRVLMRSGPFAGIEGVVIKRFNETRLLVAVNFLKQGASVQIEDCQVQRIDS